MRRHVSCLHLTFCATCQGQISTVKNPATATFPGGGPVGGNFRVWVPVPEKAVTFALKQIGLIEKLLTGQISKGPMDTGD